MIRIVGSPTFEYPLFEEKAWWWNMFDLIKDILDIVLKTIQILKLIKRPRVKRGRRKKK